MFEKILYIASEKQDEKGFVMDLARKHNSTVLLSAVMLPGHKSTLPTESRTRPDVRREEQERRCWQDLYSLEQEFKSVGIKSSVVVQEGDVGQLRSLVTSTHCDLVVLASGNLAERNYRLPEELLASLPCPLIITQSG
ncbi:MAG: hypothetical protein ABIL25_01050 [candidate division WOR-3 bacterium]